MESLHQRQEDLRQLIAQAKQEAPFVEELEAHKDHHDRLLRDFLHGKSYQETFSDDFKHESKGIIIFNDLIDFIMGLEVMGYSKEIIDELVSHENDHLAKALSLGATGSYQIQLCKMPNGKYSMYPSCVIGVSDSLPEEEQRRIWKEIINAPEELSPRDLEQLGE